MSVSDPDDDPSSLRPSATLVGAAAGFVYGATILSIKGLIELWNPLPDGWVTDRFVTEAIPLGVFWGVAARLAWRPLFIHAVAFGVAVFLPLWLTAPWRDAYQPLLVTAWESVRDFLAQTIPATLAGSAVSIAAQRTPWHFR